MIDLFVSGIAGAVMGGGVVGVWASGRKPTVVFDSAEVMCLRSDLRMAKSMIAAYKATLDTQQAQRVNASKAATAAREARAIADKKARPAAVAKTMDAIASLSAPMRSRAQVVASVKAKRTRAKRSAAA